MTVLTHATPVNFNLAVETLKKTLKRDRAAAAALSQAQALPFQERQNIDVSGVSSNSNLGQHIRTNA
jgi:hypothetical protein